MSRKKSLRVLVMMHESLVPPTSLEGYSDKEIVEWKTEYDVMTGLTLLGHEPFALGVGSELAVIREAITEHQPHLVFNLLEEFDGKAMFDQHVLSYIELLGQRYTGCNPRGLVLARDKALSKKILSYHRIRVPGFAAFPRRRRFKRPSKLRFPMIVKALAEEGSYGISQSSVVTTAKQLEDRVAFYHEQLGIPAIAEEFIEGRELYLSVLGNHRLRVFPPIELLFGDLGHEGFAIATRKVKWDWAYQKKHGIDSRVATDLSAVEQDRLARLAKRIYRLLGLSGYARIDVRLDPQGDIYFLEANPNPDIAYGSEYPESAHAAGLEYEDLLQQILRLGVAYQADWRLS